MNLSETTEIERSKYGYGGKPEIEKIKEPDRQIRLSEIKIPTIWGLLEGGVIHHREARPLDLTATEWEFKSGELTPNEPLIEGFPDSKDKVKITVIYKVSRTLE